MEWTPEMVIAALKKAADKDGFVGYKSSPGSLRAAAERRFGTWQKACKAAGVKAKPRGRPKKS